MPRVRILPLLIAVLAACGPGELAVPEPRELSVPAAAGAGQPFVARWGTGLVASWVEPDGTGHALRFARWDGGAWSDARTIARGEDWFVNWADFPSVLALSDLDLAAHWLQRSGPGTYAYDVMLTRSADGGTSWSAPVRPHRDGTETEHGFATLFPHDEGVGVVWLDGRMYAGGTHGDSTGEMAVRFTTLPAVGAAGPEILLDGRACDCCQTAVALAEGGPVVFYRDRSPEEVRDIAVTRLVGGGWTPPAPVHADGWVIGGCPVNGPAADADGATVAVAWFTAAGEAPRVQVAFSADGGASFGPPVRVDDGDAIGRVDLLLMPAGRAFVVWLENIADGAELRGRLVAADGTAGPSRRLAATSAMRASGFPRMARTADDVVLLWTEPGDPSRIRGAVLGF
jgi:hypothetical protein